MLLREQRRKEELDAAKEKQKQDERIRRTKAAMEENTRQMEQKKKQAEQEKDQGIVLREKFRNDVEVYKKSVEEERYALVVNINTKSDIFINRRDDKMKRLQYREVLQKQAEEIAKVDRNLTGITEKEKELNRSILAKVSEDPLMMSRVLHRIRIGKVGESSGKA